MYKTKHKIATEGGEPTRREQQSGNYTNCHEKLRVCPECRIVWEGVVSTGNVKAYTEYYSDFPRYGKPEIVCPKCSGGLQ